MALMGAIVPAPGVQILRLVNIESQFTGFEGPRFEAMVLGGTQVLGEAVWTEAQTDGMGRRAHQRVGSDMMAVGDDRYAPFLQVGTLQQGGECLTGNQWQVASDDERVRDTYGGG